jgi:uracil-DNA glycosylase
VESPPLDPRQELADLALAVRGLTELDRLLGVGVAPVPAPLSSSTTQVASGTSARDEDAPLRPPAFATRSRKPAPAPARAPAAPPAVAKRSLPGADLPLPQRRVQNEGRLHALASQMAGCQQCGLSKGRTKLVFGQGDAAAELVFVGEGPGYHEDMQGLAFVGPSGALLTKMINAMGYLREEVFICNVVKCRPPRNRNPQPDEMGTCLPFLRKQLEIIQPKVICALGKTAAVGLGMIAPDSSLGRNRGKVLEWEGIPTVLTYHPAYLLRTPAEKRKAWADLQLTFPHLERRRPKPIKPDETERA